MYIQEKITKLSNHQIIKSSKQANDYGLLHAETSRPLCLDDESGTPHIHHRRSKYNFESALQDEEINADPGYNDG